MKKTCVIIGIYYPKLNAKHKKSNNIQRKQEKSFIKKAIIRPQYNKGFGSGSN